MSADPPSLSYLFTLGPLVDAADPIGLWLVAETSRGRYQSWSNFDAHNLGTQAVFARNPRLNAQLLTLYRVMIMTTRATSLARGAKYDINSPYYKAKQVLEQIRAICTQIAANPTVRTEKVINLESPLFRELFD